MEDSRLVAPVMAALSIREQYHKDIEKRLSLYGLDENTRSTILTDIYAKDDLYFSLNRPYEHISSIFEVFCKERKIHTFLPDMLLTGRKIYTHQAQAIDSILAEKTTIISTGTGSGKTESFLIPILHHCLVQGNHHVPGIKAIILYPLNALASDQIRRILEAVKGRGIRVGCFVGSTPYDKKRTENDQEELCISRKEMIEQPPDILITNYVMLDRLITKANTYSMFVNSMQMLKYIVVDEIHYFRGTKGANLSLLLRRLRTLCKGPLIQIGASGTLRRDGGYYPNQTEDQIELFARLIFGQEAINTKGFTLVEPVFLTTEEKEQPELLPKIDTIVGETFLTKLDLTRAMELCNQLFGPAMVAEYQQKYCQSGKSITNFPGYHLARRSSFIRAIQHKLARRACSFHDLVELFQEIYEQTHGQALQDPQKVVEAYWSLINYLNNRCPEKALPLILDYRIHLILGDVGETLTRCLLCQRYHDGRCLRCRHCNNGLLFKVSKAYPDRCIAYLAENILFVNPIPGRCCFPVLVEFAVLQDTSLSQPVFTLEANSDQIDGEESYRLQPVVENSHDGIMLQLIQQKQEEEALRLNENYKYWHNVLKIIDALVVDPDIKSADKLLSFIDSRERASGIKIRLNDDIAERTLTAWAVTVWKDSDSLNLVDAFEQLQKSSPSDDENEDLSLLSELLCEMPFWFRRMLTYLEEDTVYAYWKISIDSSLVLDDDERELLGKIMLRSSAVDMTQFGSPAGIHSLKHFHVDKYRVETQYGVGMVSSAESGYHILSLGEHGMLHQESIQRIGSTELEERLKRLTSHGILVEKTTPANCTFYQLDPRYVLIELIDEAPQWKTAFATVECHTADNSDQERSDIEQRFSHSQIQALICTPTLEMGVDIGQLLSVLMIGFPPSPANYAQRAGRAGRSGKSRLATIVVLSSSDDMHDEYYYAVPYKMIDGEITPPQFTLINFSLLAAHAYAYVMAGAKDMSLLTQSYKLKEKIRLFLADDILQLSSTLGGEQYRNFSKYLENDCQELPARLHELIEGQPTAEDCYKHGVFPDYGFRNDGLPLVDVSVPTKREDQLHLLTSREPEEAPRRLVPGRIVFCGGRAVKVEENQPRLSYELCQDPMHQVFRRPRYVIADTTKTIQIERRRDPNQLYRLSRFLDIKNPLQFLEVQGRQYCQIYYIPESTLYFINEGEVRQADQPLARLQDHDGPYRFGTLLEREGLLVRFATRILPPNAKANFLAVLLRAIPDYFNLDDGELRVVQNVFVFPQNSQQIDRPADFFLYGHDKSGLIPFQKIFDHLKVMLSRALDTLRSCSCGGNGCYLCLFSMNSHSLTGRLSHSGAVEFLSAYLGEERLKPYLAFSPIINAQVDLTLLLRIQGGEWKIIAHRKGVIEAKNYTAKIQENQNEALYLLLYHVLVEQRKEGAQSVRICCRLDYVLKQLRGENDVKQGREAFFNMWLERLKWQYWQVVKEDNSW